MRKNRRYLAVMDSRQFPDVTDVPPGQLDEQIENYIANNWHKLRTSDANGVVLVQVMRVFKPSVRRGKVNTVTLNEEN